MVYMQSSSKPVHAGLTHAYAAVQQCKILSLGQPLQETPPFWDEITSNRP